MYLHPAHREELVSELQDLWTMAHDAAIQYDDIIQRLEQLLKCVEIWNPDTAPIAPPSLQLPEAAQNLFVEWGLGLLQDIEREKEGLPPLTPTTFRQFLNDRNYFF